MVGESLPAFISSYLLRHTNVTSALFVTGARRNGRLSANPEMKVLQHVFEISEHKTNLTSVLFLLVSVSLKKAVKCSLHLLILQSGSCEFGANDSG